MAITPGFRAPWNKDGWSSQEAADKEHQQVLKQKLDYEKLAAISANVIRQQLDLIRRKQIEMKRRRGGDVPEHLKVTKEDIEFMFRANREILGCRDAREREKREEKEAKKEARKKRTRDSFVDPRGDEGEIVEDPQSVEGGWETDGRGGT